ncbi:MAG: LEA type 2 family protein [Methylobacter sp.]|nr:LEA type 2 family protein [Methylobacter sp.]
MKKKYWLGLLCFAGLLLLAYGWWNFNKPDGEGMHLKPTLKVAAINDLNIEPERITMTSKIILSNPLPINIKTNRLDYRVFIDSVKVVESSYTKPISIYSADQMVIEVPIEILKEPLARLLQHFEKHKTETADHTVKATFKVDLPVLGERKFSMEFTKRLPVFRPPTLKTEDVDVNSLGLDESKIDLVTQISNPNLFPLKLKDGKYTFTVDNEITMAGSLENIIDIPAKGSSPVAMHLDLKTTKMGKFLWKMLFDKAGTPFNVKFRCKMLTDSKMLKNSNILFNLSGTLDDLTKK